MINLRRMSNYDVLREGQRLLNLAGGEDLPFEFAAQFIADTLYQSIVGDDEQPIFALLRIFRLCDYESLSPELTEMVKAKDSPFMVLMGTFGKEESWRDRRESKSRQIMSLKQLSPMMTAAMQQIGLSAKLTAMDMESDKTIQRSVFYEPLALNSPHIPEQEEFVKKYEIASAVGIGDSLSSRAIFLLVAFSIVPLKRDDVQKFQTLLPLISSHLSKHEANLWDNLGL